MIAGETQLEYMITFFTYASPSIPNSGVHGHRQQRISYTWSFHLIGLETSSEMAKLFILIDQSQEDAGKMTTMPISHAWPREA